MIPAIALVLALAPATAPVPVQESPAWVELQEARRVVHAQTGLRFSWLASLLRRSVVSTDTPWGLRVRAVAAGSPADTAGLREGDIVLEWNGAPLRSLTGLGRRVETAPPGARFELVVARRDADASWLTRDPWSELRATLELP